MIKVEKDTTMEYDTPLDFVRVFDNNDEMVLSMTVTEAQWFIKDLENVLKDIYRDYFQIEDQTEEICNEFD